jgi:hypothetical protein
MSLSAVLRETSRRIGVATMSCSNCAILPVRFLPSALRCFTTVDRTAGDAAAAVTAAPTTLDALRAKVNAAQATATEIGNHCGAGACWVEDLASKAQAMEKDGDTFSRQLTRIASYLNEMPGSDIEMKPEMIAAIEEVCSEAESLLEGVIWHNQQYRHSCKYSEAGEPPGLSELADVVDQAVAVIDYGKFIASHGPGPQVANLIAYTCMQVENRWTRPDTYPSFHQWQWARDGSVLEIPAHHWKLHAAELSPFVEVVTSAEGSSDDKTQVVAKGALKMLAAIPIQESGACSAATSRCDMLLRVAAEEVLRDGWAQLSTSAGVDDVQPSQAWIDASKSLATAVSSKLDSRSVF